MTRLLFAPSFPSSLGFNTKLPFRGLLLLTLIPLFFFNGCADAISGPSTPALPRGCNIQAYINVGIQDYLSTQYRNVYPLRAAIIPFDVPESFAPPGQSQLRFGHDLARKFQRKLFSAELFHIVEIFDRDGWPGKRDEFFGGNYRAIDLARKAGYDFVIVGQMEKIRDAETLVFYTKIIDTSRSITLWFGKTDVYSAVRPVRSFLADWFIVDDRPELFEIQERADLYPMCTMEHVLKGELSP